MTDTAVLLPNSVQKMRRYFERPQDELSSRVDAEPVCLYLEVTNRCNLLCTTCPRTFEELEPEADMSWELFTKIVSGVDRLERVVLHGVGEPMLVKNLPEMVRYLKDRGVYVLFNTNGTLLTEKNGRALIDAGLDEMRVSLDAADASVFKMVRGRDMFDRIVANLHSFRQMQQSLGIETPRVSMWLTGLRETLNQLEGFVRLADSVNVREIYLQRMVFFSDNSQGLARAESALFEMTTDQEEETIERAVSLATSLGVSFNASGATEPGTSIKKRAADSPWSLCRRPWTLMYFTATGRALPCCIAPFSMHGYDSFTLGDASQQTLREIWNGPRYQQFRSSLMTTEPPRACANCGLRWSL
jgi:MoaA/NifB/PqqE/SkfB family radical SAM enzyme